MLALTYGGCTYSEVSRLKSLINNINISYDYHIKNNKAYFDITINNIPKDVYFVDSETKKKYYYSNTTNGEITIKDQTGSSGSYKFYSALSKCEGIYLNTKYYKLPIYNVYYGDKLCEDIPEYSLCQKWANVGYSRSKFEKMVYEYKKGEPPIDEEKPEIKYEKSWLDNIIDIYAKYYYMFLIGVILICGLIILLRRKKDTFNL